MTTTLVLTLPDFTTPFELEIDTCNSGIGAVLMQNGKSLAFMSKPLSLRNFGLSAYEHEMLAIMEAMKKWKIILIDLIETKNTFFAST